MTNSSFCLQQRQHEDQKSRNFLAIGLASSLVLHGVLGSGVIRFKADPKTASKPIELIVVDAPKPVPEVVKLKQEPPKPLKVTPPPPKPQAAKLEPIQPKIENRQTPAKSAQPRVVTEAPKPKTSAPPEPNIRSNPVQPSKRSVNPAPTTKTRSPITNTRSQQSIITGSDRSAPKVSVPDTPISQGDDNASIATSSSSNQGISGTGNSQGGSGNGQGGEGGGGGGGDGTGNSGTSNTVTTRPTPKPIPKAKPKVGECIRNCKVKYPSVLNGVEGTVYVRITVDNQGNVINVELAQAHSNSLMNEQALLVAKDRKYAPRPGEGNLPKRERINFTAAGSDFARERERQRQAREQRERQARERQEQQRQAQLEKERQERQRQQEQERPRQQQQQQQPGQPSTGSTPAPEPIIPDIPETNQ